MHPIVEGRQTPNRSGMEGCVKRPKEAARLAAAKQQRQSKLQETRAAPPSLTRCLQAALPRFQALKPRDRERDAELTAGWAALPYPTPRLWRALPWPHLSPAWLSGRQTHSHVAHTCVPTAPCRRTNSGFGLILFKEGLSSEPFPLERGEPGAADPTHLGRSVAQEQFQPEPISVTKFPSQCSPTAAPAP